MITLSSRSVSLYFLVRLPPGKDRQFLSVHVENFSNIYAAKPTGESWRATPVQSK